MNDRARLDRRWLIALLALQLVSLLLSLIAYLPIPNGWIYWIRKAISVGVILCLFLLTPADLRYRKAAFSRTAVFCCTMLSLLLSAPAADLIFSLLNTLFSIAACWFEYRAHGGLTPCSGPGLARGWLALFFASLVLTLLSWAIVLVYALLPGGVPVAAATVTSTTTLILSDLLEAAYVVLLFFTVYKTKTLSA